MSTGAITSQLDVALVVLYAFWIFFAGLIFYLRREDHREGYPMVADPAERPRRPLGPEVIPLTPRPKTFRLFHGGTVQAPGGKADTREIQARPVAAWPGAPLHPIGDPMRAAVGPGAYALREDEPERLIDGSPMIVPMRAEAAFSVVAGDPDPRGRAVIGADGRRAGVVHDLWVDRAEPQIRYLEVALDAAIAPPPAAPAPAEASAPAPDAPDAGAAEASAAPPPAVSAVPPAPRTVLLPVHFASISRFRRDIRVQAILAAQFAHVPPLRHPERVTKLEEDRICAYYGGGTLYATRRRVEPLL